MNEKQTNKNQEKCLVTLSDNTYKDRRKKKTLTLEEVCIHKGATELKGHIDRHMKVLMKDSYYYSITREDIVNIK